MTESSYDLTIVLPRYLEPIEVIEQTLRACSGIGARLSMEIIVVNDAGSTTGLDALASRWRNVRVLTNPINRGKGYSVRRGILAARGRHVFFTDVDLPVAVSDIEAAYARLAMSSVPMLIGCRVRVAGSPQANANRRFTSRLFMRLFRLILGSQVRDPQCPFKMFDSAVARRLFENLEIQRYAFDTEIVYKAESAGLAVQQVNVAWRDLRGSWGMTRSLGVFVRMISDLVRIRLAYSVDCKRAARLRGTLPAARGSGAASFDPHKGRGETR
jgi:dolichyl-phosphate beta-glucosyltransferase